MQAAAEVEAEVAPIQEVPAAQAFLEVIDISASLECTLL